MAAINITDLTSGSLTGNGVFDKLMEATEAHIENEFKKGRIKGSEYATVYLGAMQTVMDQALQFLLNQQRTDLEAQLIAEQIETEKKRQAQIQQQTDNLAAEALNIPKQGILLDKQADQVDAETARANQQTINLKAEELGIDAQTALTEQQEKNLASEKLQIESRTALIDQERLNAVTQEEVLQKQICKLNAEFDLLSEQKLKVVAETALLTQKKVTEKAQTVATGVDENSVIGRQRNLYKNQAEGFLRDAEQKGAKIMLDAWNVQRTTDPTGISANDSNKLNDPRVGAAVQKLLDGIGA